jgi:hypothetical protein
MRADTGIAAHPLLAVRALTLEQPVPRSRTPQPSGRVFAVAGQGRTSYSRVAAGGAEPRSRPYFVGLTVTVNDAFAVLALRSLEEHVTRVLPILKRLPDLRVQATGRVPSRSSRAVTLKTTRAGFRTLSGSHRLVGRSRQCRPREVEFEARHGERAGPRLVSEGALRRRSETARDGAGARCTCVDSGAARDGEGLRLCSRVVVAHGLVHAFHRGGELEMDLALGRNREPNWVGTRLAEAVGAHGRPGIEQERVRPSHPSQAREQARAGAV